ncbi:hypothetical protein LCGC14_2707350 [marine sediment metagenome]|uniref:XkdX family protein n=1 Tax=marine sediment metagenome TaxID=412755 RepID=A0A0F8ZE33_9ZZZZ
MSEVNYEDSIWERIEFAKSYFAKGYLMALLDEKLITIDQWHRLSDKSENREVNK